MTMKQRYSFASLIRHGINKHTTWAPAWRTPPLKDHYDVIVIGAGGHGLATAYHLGKDHGITNVAVLDSGWLGGGNIARNTITIRSNYMRDESIPFYVKSVELYEGLTKDLNFNMMHSKRTMIDVIQNYPMMRDRRRRQHIMDIYNSTYEKISTEEVRRRIPALTGGGPDARLPIIGGMVHTDAGVNRHDAVAWGYARAIDGMGGEIHQQTPVTQLVRGTDGSIAGVQTPRGLIRADKIVVAVSGHTTTLTETVGLKLPLRTMNLTAFVSEPVKPLVDVIVNCPDAGFYFSQSDKGEMVIGGGTDGYNNYTQRGSFHHVEETVRALNETFPMLSRLKMLRQWGGIVDVTGDRSPILSKTPVDGVFINCGWGTGGFKSIPGSGWGMAELMAKGQSPLTEEFGMRRFKDGKFIDESVAAGVAH